MWSAPYAARRPQVAGAALSEFAVSADGTTTIDGLTLRAAVDSRGPVAPLVAPVRGTLARDEYLVLGDNEAGSIDSRCACCSNSYLRCCVLAAAQDTRSVPRAGLPNAQAGARCSRRISWDAPCYACYHPLDSAWFAEGARSHVRGARRGRSRFMRARLTLRRRRQRRRSARSHRFSRQARNRVETTTASLRQPAARLQIPAFPGCGSTIRRSGTRRNRSDPMRKNNRK